MGYNVYPNIIGCKCLLFVSMLGLLLLPLSLPAKTVELKISESITATADYRKGNANKPAVLVLHGFLSTRNFRTVYNLTNALFDEGYTVLAPNLSLGVNRRKVSLACEAIHTHTLEDDLKEIDKWVNWLGKKGHTTINMVGHSFGSLEALVYTRLYPHKISKLIATSLVDVEHVIGQDVSKSQIRTANSMLDNDNRNLFEFRLSYCKKYVAPPLPFLSYAKWTKGRIVDALKNSKSRVSVILGGADKRMGSNWADILKKNGVQLLIIDDANHFFDAQFEFDLQDRVIELLETTAK